MDYQAKTNWTYNDTVTEQDMNRIEAGLGDLHQRLDTPATSGLVLQPGTQTIQVERDTPFHLSGISGRMLLNLLGRNGNCESLNGWAFSGTAALNTSQFVAGTASIQITAGSGGGIMSRSVELKVGKTYVLAASIKLGTATGAAVSVTGIMNGSVVTSSSNFTTSYMRFTATSSTHTVAVVLQATQGQTAYVDAIRLYEVSSAEYSQLSSMTASQVDQMYPYTEGLAGVKNPYAIRWTSAAKTDVAAMLAFDTELLAPPVPADDAERDRLEQGVDGQYYKNSNWIKRIVNDQSWSWGFSSDGNRTGYKKVYAIIQGIAASVYAIKYNGDLIPQVAGDISDYGANKVYVNAGNGVLEYSIAQADSGWGDNYTPTVDEIKAYFFGWRMYNADAAIDGTISYNGSGVKAWGYRVGRSSNNLAGGTTTLPTTLAPNFTPYELMYRRSSKASIPIASEGSLTLMQGNNTIEVGTGLILRESVWPQISGEFHWINGNTLVSSAAKNRVRNFLQIYRNGRSDLWKYLGFSTDTDRNTYGLQQAQIPIDRYDPDSTYSASYLLMENYPTVIFQGSTAKNENRILIDLIRNMQQTTRRVGVIESRKVEKDASSVWIKPTLLNTWSSDSNNPILYRKKDNTVSLTGVVLNGITGVGSIIFRLPEGYRPRQENHFASYTYQISDGAFGLAEIITKVNGDVILGQGGKSYLSFAGISFSII